MQHHGQLPGLLAQARKHRQQARKALFLRQGRCQRRAFAHQHQRVKRVGTQRAVVQCFCGGLQGLQDGHPGARQHGQRACKPCGVIAARQLAHQGQIEPDSIELLANMADGERPSCPNCYQNCSNQHHPAIAAHKGAEAQHGHRQERQRALGACKHAGHLRHHIAHQEQHDHDGHQGHDGRVQRGAHQLGLERLAFFQVVGQALQNQAQVAAVLAGADHGAIDVRELARVLRQRAGKGGARVDLGAQRGDQVALAFVVGFFGQRGQRALQRQARRHQPGDLPCPDGQPGRAEHRPGEEALAQAGGPAVQRLACLHHFHRQRYQRLGPQQAARGLGGVGLQEAFAGLALGVQGFKGKSRHANAGVGDGAWAWKSRSPATANIRRRTGSP